jgi:hypothetical protein
VKVYNTSLAVNGYLRAMVNALQGSAAEQRLEELPMGSRLHHSSGGKGRPASHISVMTKMAID